MADLFGSSSAALNAEEIMKLLVGATEERGQASRYKLDATPSGPGFNFRVGMRQVTSERIIDLAE